MVLYDESITCQEDYLVYVFVLHLPEIVVHQTGHHLHSVYSVTVLSYHGPVMTADFHLSFFVLSSFESSRLPY